MLSNLKKYQLILASNSPRRKELMSGLGVEYVVRTLPDVDESYPETLVGAAIPEYISRKKADAYRSMMKPGELLICLLYTSPSPRDMRRSRMPSSA